MTEPTIGNWYRVTSGPHKGKRGVCDLIKTEGAGTRYRLSHPHLKEPVGRFAAEQLEPTTAPVYESKVTPEAQQRAFDVLTGGSVKA